MKYACLICDRSSDDPLEVKPCKYCEDLFCTGCLPDHEALCAKAQPQAEVKS